MTIVRIASCVLGLVIMATTSSIAQSATTQAQEMPAECYECSGGSSFGSCWYLPVTSTPSWTICTETFGENGRVCSLSGSLCHIFGGMSSLDGTAVPTVSVSNFAIRTFGGNGAVEDCEGRLYTHLATAGDVPSTVGEHFVI